MKTVHVNEHVRYEPDERCPPLVSIGVALQGVMLTLATTVLIVVITVRAADEGESYLSWAVFAALAVSGVTTALQAIRLGRLGAGHVLMTGASPHFLAVSVMALAEGGLAMLASLIVVSSLMSVRIGRMAPVAATDHHAGRLWHGAHADSGHGHTDRIRQA